MRLLVASLLMVMVLLQYRFWLGDGGVLEVRRLAAASAEQRLENDELRARNEALEAEVRDLKDALEAVEERARSELGMIKDGETFYRIVEQE